jgi:2-dehydropantoate 2-reductase
MKKKYRIAIVGIGGIGGFIGAKLAMAYRKSDDIEIIFVARGTNAQAIKENGLKLITSQEEVLVSPDVVADEVDTVGLINLLICCTKAYDLEESLKQLSQSITADTLILPLLNGVDSSFMILSLLPDAKVLEGCIYLVSKLIAPGIVQQRGDFYAVHFGGDKMLTPEMNKLLDLFERANINTILEDNIREKVWGKFSFISPIATYTSAYDISIGKILESEGHRSSIKKLMSELIELAKTQNIILPADTIDKNFFVMAKLPYEATSSMQADFAGGKSTELETLTGSVVRRAIEKEIQADSYNMMYELLLERQS